MEHYGPLSVVAIHLQPVLIAIPNPPPHIQPVSDPTTGLVIWKPSSNLLRSSILVEEVDVSFGVEVPGTQIQILENLLLLDELAPQVLFM